MLAEDLIAELEKYRGKEVFVYYDNENLPLDQVSEMVGSNSEMDGCPIIYLTDNSPQWL